MNVGDLESLNTISGLISEPALAGAQVLKIPVDKVKSKSQVRRNFKKTEELGLSLIAEGQQTPIIVCPRDSSGFYVIQKGERRWRAAKHVGMEKIDVIIKLPPEDRVQELAGELIENIQREDLLPVEIAYALQEMVAEGLSQKQVADRLGKSEKYVSSHLSLTRLPECILTLSDEGLVNDTDTLIALRRIHEISPVVCKSTCDAALEDGGISRKEARDILRKLNTPKVEEEPALSANHIPPSDNEQDEQDIDEVGPTQKKQENISSQSTDDDSDDGYDDSNDEGDEQQAVVASPVDKYDKEQMDWVGSGADLVDEEAEAEAEVNSDKEKWLPTAPADVLITVKVMVRDIECTGHIMLNRVSQNSSYVWVYLDREKVGHLALVSDVTLSGVKKDPARV